MSIKKILKKQKARKNRIMFTSILIIILMPYMVAVLNDERIFKGWEIYFAFSYAAIVDIILFVYIVKTLADDALDFHVNNQKMKLKDGILKPLLTIHMDRIVYVDILEKLNDNFEVFILMNKGKRNKNFQDFNIGFIKKHSQYKEAYKHMEETNRVVDFYSYSISRAGVRKYYLIYLIFKNAYKAEFSPKALEYVRAFMEEYNMS